MSKLDRSHKRQKTSTKQRRNRPGDLGAPSADDNPTSSTNQPSSSALSTRHVHDPDTPLPSLLTLSARVVAHNFRRLGSHENWPTTREWLRTLPDSVVPTLFSFLKDAHPAVLSHEVISANFLRGSSINLDDSVGVTKGTLSAISRYMGGKLTSLQLNNISNPSDGDFASLVNRLPNLEILNLRGCAKVGPTTVGAVTKACKQLKVINFSETAVTAISLAPLLVTCDGLEVLKIAGIQNFTDATGTRLIQEISSDEHRRPLSALKTLKLRRNPISEVVVLPLLGKCVNSIERVDVSFTLIKQSAHWHFPPIPNVEKISLTSTLLLASTLVDLVRCTPRLRVLNIGALGVRPQSSALQSLSTAMTLNDGALRNLTIVLKECCPDIENINLVQNGKLGSDGKHDRAVADFLRKVGRQCKTLNLSGIPHLRSSDLEGFASNGVEQPCSIRTLYLNKTGVDDYAVPWISACESLEILEVAETKLSSVAEGLFRIIDACPKLRALNLTGCRGVKVGDRRRFFEVWEEHKEEHVSDDDSTYCP